MTRAIAAAYSDAVHGRDDRYRHWCETL